MRTETWSGNKGKTILRNFPFWSRDLGSWKEFKWAFGPLKPDGEENCVATCTPLYEEVCEHNDEFPENVYAPECKNVLVGFECFEYCWSSPSEPEDPCPWGDCEDECPYGDCDEGPCADCEEPDPEPDPCDKVATQFANANYKAKANELKGKTNLKYESGFEEKKNGGYNALTNNGNDALHADPSNDTKGYVHNHVDDYETGELNPDGNPIINKPIKMFSPADVNTLMNLVDKNRSSGDFSEYYVSMVTNGYGHYMLKFTGNASDIKTGFGGGDWDKKYIDHMQKFSNLEKGFLQFLKNEMNVTGVELFKVKNNGQAKSIALKPNGKSVEEKDC